MVKKLLELFVVCIVVVSKCIHSSIQSVSSIWIELSICKCVYSCSVLLIYIYIYIYIYIVTSNCDYHKRPLKDASVPLSEPLFGFMAGTCVKKLPSLKYILSWLESQPLVKDLDKVRTVTVGDGVFSSSSFV